MDIILEEDEAFVAKFRAQAEEVILENILRDEAGEGILVLENFEETIKRADEISEAAILKESQTLAAKSASGVLGSLRVLPRAIKSLNWLELGLALGTIIIVFGFKRVTTKVPSTLVALISMTIIAVGFDLNYQSIEDNTFGYSCSAVANV